MWEWCSWMRVIASNWLVRKWVCLAIYHLCFNCLIGIQVTTRTTSIHTVHQKHWNNQLIVAMVISGYFVIVWQMGSVLLWSLLINVQVEIVVLFYRFQTSPHWYWLLLSLLCSEKEIFKKRRQLCHLYLKANEALFECAKWHLNCLPRNTALVPVLVGICHKFTISPFVTNLVWSVWQKISL